MTLYFTSCAFLKDMKNRGIDFHEAALSFFLLFFLFCLTDMLGQERSMTLT